MLATNECALHVLSYGYCDKTVMGVLCAALKAWGSLGACVTYPVRFVMVPRVMGCLI